MTHQEIMTTRFGEMADLIACLAIYNGAEPKKIKKKYTFQEAMALR